MSTAGTKPVVKERIGEVISAKMDVGQPATLQGLQAIGAEGKMDVAGGKALATSPLGLPVFDAFGK